MKEIIFDDVRKELQKNIAKTIANKIETEFSGDIKKILKNTQRGKIWLCGYISLFV